MPFFKKIAVTNQSKLFKRNELRLQKPLCFHVKPTGIGPRTEGELVQHRAWAHCKKKYLPWETVFTKMKAGCILIHIGSYKLYFTFVRLTWNFLIKCRLKVFKCKRPSHSI